MGDGAGCVSREAYRGLRLAIEPGGIAMRKSSLCLRKWPSDFHSAAFDRLFQLIRRFGLTWNNKRPWRVYRPMRLNRHRRDKIRVPNCHPLPLVPGDQINAGWSIDFVFDALSDRRRFRTFKVIDDFNRRAFANEVDLNLTETRVIRTLELTAAWREGPTKLRPNDGPDFVDFALTGRVERKGINLEFIEPGKRLHRALQRKLPARCPACVRD